MFRPRKERTAPAAGPSGGAADAPATGFSHDLLDLWFALDRRSWSSLVLTPADAEGSTDELAEALAEAGQALSEHPVSALTFKVLTPDSVRALAALVEHIGVRNQAPGWPSAPAAPLKRLVSPGPSGEPNSPGAAGEEPVWTAGFRTVEGDGAGEAGLAGGERVVGPVGRLVIAIPSVLAQPLGIAIARAADAVVLAVDLGGTRMEEAARTARVIGRDHLVGACLVRPGARNPKHQP